MFVCKKCKKELPSSEFDEFFSQEAFENQLCDDCYNAEAKERYIRAKKEYDEHPDWFLSPPSPPRLRRGEDGNA